jgi:hypothetical protein
MIGDFLDRPLLFEIEISNAIEWYRHIRKDGTNGEGGSHWTAANQWTKQII